MSRRNAFLSACLLVICCVGSMSGQQPAASANNRSNVVVPPLVNFSGVLNDVNGKALNRITGVTFLLYKEEQGGAPLWMETQNVYPDKTGHYTVMLGSTTSNGLPGDIFVAGEARWLAVQAQGQAEQPRILLLSVPYALKAADAQTVGGLPASAFVLAAPPTRNATSSASASAVAQPLATGTTPVTTAGGTINKLAKFDATADATSSQIFDNGTNVGIGNTAPAGKLDVSGGAFVRGVLALPTTGTATATAGKNSQPIAWTASAFNSGTATAVNQIFRLQAEPAGNNTATTSGTLNLLYAAGTAALAETGLKIASNGRITFAAGQTFPGTGSGTITGVTAGTDLTGGGASGKVTLNLDITKVPQLATANTFTGNQTVNGNVSATGLVTGTGFNIGSVPFAFGSSSLANAFLGFAGNATTTGSGNTASGSSALLANTTGSENTASGYTALFQNSSGYDNTASGSGALSANTTGHDNTASGYQALLANTTGNQNTASGGGALYHSTSSYNNAAHGYWALYNNTTGNDNTGSGAQALFYNTTGSNNTAFGYNAGPDQNSPGLSNTTAIGANAVVSQSNAVVLGGTGANAVKVGIGTAKPAYTLDVQGTGRFTQPIVFASSQTFPGTITGVTAGTDLTGGGSGGVQTLNLDLTKVPQLAAANTFTGNQTVNGNLSTTGVVTGNSFQIGSNLFAFGQYSSSNAFLGFAGNPATNSTWNTGVGPLALGADTTGNYNTASGASALSYNTTGSYNTASGAFSLFYNTADDNTASGSQALLNNTTGAGNTATGFDALYYNTTGGYNTADGYQALYNAAGLYNTGGWNTASGSGTLKNNTTGNYNTAGGASALEANTTGSGNTGVGVLTLEHNTTGQNNTGVGYFAFSNYQRTGSGNTCIGYLCDVSVDGLSNATAIGEFAKVGESNALVLGGTGTYAVSVGIGTIAPGYTLDVQGTGNFTGPVKFAASQTFPGTGTITGVTTSASSGLSGGGTSGTLNLGLTTSCGSGQVLAWTGSAWACSTTVTGVTPGTDLTGGGAGGNVTLNLDTTKVPQLAAANTFTGAQTINNNVTVTASGQALVAYSAAGQGVVGGSSTGIGVEGAGGYYGMYSSASVAAGVGLFSQASNNGYGVVGEGDVYGVYAKGNFGATGTKSAVVALPDDRVVLLYAVESPENWFEDFGSGKLKDGTATVELDATFAQTVNTGTEYHVFLTPKGDCKGLYVTHETAGSFEVRELGSGQSNVAFDYRIVAKRKGLETLRLEEQHADHETAEAIRQQIAARPSHPPRLKTFNRPPQAVVPEVRK